MADKQIKVTLVKGLVNRTPNQKANVKQLGLHKIGQSVVVADDPVHRGMILKVRHLVTVEEAN
ncbi:MAG: 50S ribosomal protein L30 [Bifidobacteriaceae bacterium]|nr:50S ribosomal protein L30 [Bifidobacteriaceae bacterium]